MVLLLATLGNHLLPKAGAWMERVKSFFGLLLLGVALFLAIDYILSRLAGRA